MTDPGMSDFTKIKWTVFDKECVRYLQSRRFSALMNIYWLGCLMLSYWNLEKNNNNNNMQVDGC